LFPHNHPGSGAGNRLTAVRLYGSFADLMRLLSDGAWWHTPVIRPGPLLVIVILSTVLWTFRTALLLAFLLQVTSMALTLGGRFLRLRHLRQVARTMASGENSERRGVMTSWKAWAVAEHTRRQVERLREVHEVQELVIGRIDRNGRVLGLFGRLPGLPATTAAEFASGSRFRLDIVLIGDHVLVRKDFQGDRIRFYAEWSSLVYLAGRVNVPAVHYVDEHRGIIYKDLVVGKTIRDLLVDDGARILNAQTAGDLDLRPLPQRMRKCAIEARGTAVLHRCLPEHVLDEVERQMWLIHEYRVTGVSHTFQNVVIELSSGAPWFIDCEHGRIHPSRASWRFSVVREYERARFAQRYARGSYADKPSPAAVRADPEAVRPRA
jgi:hypothetical protein